MIMYDAVIWQGIEPWVFIQILIEDDHDRVFLHDRRYRRRGRIRPIVDDCCETLGLMARRVDNPVLRRLGVDH